VQIYASLGITGCGCSIPHTAPGRSRRRCSERGLVEKAIDRADAVARGDHDVEADRGGPATGSAGVPHEARLVVVGVDGAGEGEPDAGELGLDVGDEAVEAGAAGDGAEWIAVGAVVGIELVDRGAALRGAALRCAGRRRSDSRYRCSAVRDWPLGLAALIASS
jgi:hypothetical protein